MEADKFTWTKFYSDFADKLLPCKNSRGELLSIIEAVAQGDVYFVLKCPK